MFKVKSSDLKQNLGENLVRSEHEPVFVTKHNKVTNVITSYDSFNKMKNLAEKYEDLVLTAKLDKVVDDDQFTEITVEDLVNIIKQRDEA